MIRRLAPLAFLAALSLTLGCAADDAISSEAPDASLLARSLSQEAAALLEQDPAQAEQLLQQALEADPFHGPAHNNLGVLHLARGDLYQAALAFEAARKLMPGHPDPRINLAVTFDRAGRVDDAVAAYESALEVQPDGVAAMQGLAELLLRHGRSDARLDSLLSTVALRGESEPWRAWARNRLLEGPLSGR
jgi:Tfp pilus assembly protein PilF